MWKRRTVPVVGTWPFVEEGLARMGPAARPLAERAAWSPILSVQGFPPGEGIVRELWSTGAELAWLGGPAVAGRQEWPRNAGGVPLAHVATFSLRDLADASVTEEKEAWPDHRQGLPTTGALEIFHDLTVYGWEPADGEQRGWLVRWTEEPDRSRFLSAPADLDMPSQVCQAAGFMAAFSVPSPLDVASHGAATFKAAERVHAAIQQGWRPHVWGEDSGPAVPVTHAYGHSQNGAGAIREVLAEVLPLSEQDDEHRLLFDIESWTHLEGWFGDAAPLEVWMRQSDLEARAFDRAWCLTRTD